MSGGAVKRVERIALARASRRREEIADEVNAMPGLRAQVEGDVVAIEGRGLLDRWIRDASLRNIGRVRP